MKYYKFLTADNLGPYSNFDFTPYLPTDDQPAPWLPEVERLEFCESGYHACTREKLLDWLNAEMWEVEYKNDPEHGNDKVNGSCIRFLRRVDGWNDQTARLFAVWCAREALKLIDNPDPRSIAAVDVAERFANGEATIEELAAVRAAARAVAWDAAWDAVIAAARNAAWAAAWDAVRAAARAVARDVAWDAARAAAWDAQNKKLCEMLGI